MSDLNANLRAWLDQLNPMVAEQKQKGIEATPQMVRDSLAGLTAAFVTQYPEIPGVRDIEVVLTGRTIPLRLYDPEPGNAKPVLLFFHGGGHMAGSVEVYDPIARKLAHSTGWLVVSVDYRLSPETPYPGGLDDCMDITRRIWQILADEGQSIVPRLALAGDSGGGTYAAAVSRALADQPDLHIEKQVLIYPSLDYTLESPSIHSFGEGHLLEEHRIRWYFDHYFRNDENRRQASPLHQSLARRMPDTLIITAGYCPLHDEGVAYGQKLQAAGQPCTLQDYPDMIHAYLNLENLAPEACADTYQRIADFLKTED
ncbi:alpha/beta hydrolase [uncultured Marinobacter sp.]|uniref:alpha/beta hydrolase n=1 Tax=uncultured Marinobacter sp. TaxID=187379 RepID=UPI0030DCB166|tara:strand:- start:16 stop:957 length:942 start_codon:yes stop_codon:yes gene_type:complete